jgi:hypothetical protein
VIAEIVEKELKELMENGTENLSQEIESEKSTAQRPGDLQS